jgi:hypothetical protein
MSSNKRAPFIKPLDSSFTIADFSATVGCIFLGFNIYANDSITSHHKRNALHATLRSHVIAITVVACFPNKGIPKAFPACEIVIPTLTGPIRSGETTNPERDCPRTWMGGMTTRSPAITHNLNPIQLIKFASHFGTSFNFDLRLRS